MADNTYTVEIRGASKSAYFTPQESNAYYATRYSREGLTVHWWGGGEGAASHDNIVNYFIGQGNAGAKSVNYVVSDNKITLMVSPDNVAWCSQSGNPTTISVEFQPTLGDEGYKKAGWLIDQLEQRYGHLLSLYPHSKWFATSCPGSLDIGRMRAEANKWKVGEYDAPAPVPKPVPTPLPPAPVGTVQITYSILPTPIKYVVNKDSNLWNFNVPTWGAFKSVKPLVKGEPYEVYAIADNHSVHAQYGVTKYSFDRKITNGINMKDLDLAPTPQPIPEPPKPTPEVPSPGAPTPPAQEPSIPISVLEKFWEAVTKLWTEMLNKFRK